MATIGQIAFGNADLDILEAAINFLDSAESAGLATALTDPTADFTVFAPTDAAFTQLAVDLGFAGDTTDENAVATFLVTNVPSSTLLTTVQYHVSVGAKTAAELSGLGTIDTLAGVTIDTAIPRLRDKEPDLLDPSVVTADIPADNGIVHLIDRVLIPVDLAGNDKPTIAGTVAASGTEFDDNAADFDILLKAVQTAGLVDALNDAGADLTVFAPTDGAFVGLANALGFAGSDEAGAWTYLVDSLELLGKGDAVGLLTDILQYHVTTPSLQSSQVLATSDPISTLLTGATVSVAGTSLVDNDPDIGNANLVATDIQAKNGVVHAIDGVLLPVDVLPSNGAGTPAFQVGTSADEVLFGEGDQDYLSGKDGEDSLAGGGGNDVILGGNGSDYINGGGGKDHLDGGTGADIIEAGAGADLVKGGAGADVILGDHGNDTIEGGKHLDVLLGGAGADNFVLNKGDGLDWAVDFGHGNDKIDLTSFGFESFDAVKGHVFNFGKSSFVDLDGTSLFLTGSGAGHLDADDFLL